MKAVVVLGGVPPPVEAARECEGAFVVAADAGATLCRAWGVTPDVVVGDMDSVAPGVLDELEALGARIEPHPREKLHTDARLALDAALAREPDEVVFLAGAGRRLDQTLANLQLLRRAAEAGCSARAVEADARLVAVTPRRPADLALPKGAVFSVLPLTEEATGVAITGARYPLRDATMRFVDPYGVSNVSEGRVGVACATGVLAVIEPRDV